MTSHREILYSLLNKVLRLDIFLTFTAISKHLAAFHNTIRTKFSHKKLFAYNSCIFRVQGPVDFSNIALY